MTTSFHIGGRKEIRDRDMLETLESFFFTAVGYVHPPNRIFAYLKYLPSDDIETGIWKKGNTHFQRVIPEYSAINVMKTFKFLEENHPEYLFRCPINNILMSAVPCKKIQKEYFSNLEFKHLIRKEKHDRLEEKIIKISQILMDHFDFRQVDFGITGSVALQIHHTTYSDIDLIIFGRENAKHLSEELPSLVSEHHYFQPLAKKELKEIVHRKAKLFGLNQNMVKCLIDRHWNKGVFEGTRFSILPVRKSEEFDENYGDRIYHDSGIATLIAKITDIQNSYFNPAIYGISVQRFLGGAKVSNVRMLISWENFFANVAKEGETVIAKGKLERVDDVKQNETWYRLLVGSGRMDSEYILPCGLS
ncbi:MAG: hypothetical protein ACE5R6_13565 [Candidatus Heimdallarchaeota archaeon]